MAANVDFNFTLAGEKYVAVGREDELDWHIEVWGMSDGTILLVGPETWPHGALSLSESGLAEQSVRSFQKLGRPFVRVRLDVGQRQTFHLSPLRLDAKRYISFSVDQIGRFILEGPHHWPVRMHGLFKDGVKPLAAVPA